MDKEEKFSVFLEVFRDLKAVDGVSSIADYGCNIFEVHLPIRGGSKSVIPKVDELKNIYLSGSIDELAAKFHGVSLVDYLEWEAAGRKIQCSAITKKGTRCELLSRRFGGIVPAAVFVMHKGDYCHIHDEGSFNW